MILIQGTIRHQSLQGPLENLTVELWTIQSKNPIKTVKTEEGGHYVFNITDQQLSHIANGASCIEVYLRVLERDVLLAKSQKQALYPSQLPLVIDLEVLMSEDPKNIIKGIVVNAQGKPLSGIWLAAYTYRLGQKEQITEKRKTDQEGSYLLTYSFDKWAGGKKGKANFRVVAFRDAGLIKVLATSPLIVDPGVSNLVNFKITDLTLETESTFTALEGKLSSVIAELKGNKAGWNALTSQDVYLLAAELDLETKQIASFVKAQKQANNLGIAAATPLIFNLDQQGFNISLGKLLALPTSKWLEVTKKGVEDNTLEGKNRASVALIKKIREQLLELSWNGDLTSTQHWRHILEKAKLNEVGYKNFLRNFFDHEGTIEDFWSSLHGSVPTEKIQRYYRLSQLVHHHKPLFVEITKQNEIARFGHPQAWKDLIGSEKKLLPQGFQDFDQFAHEAAQQVEDWMPMAVFLDQYFQKGDPLSGFKFNLKKLADLDFSRTSLENYLRENNEIKIKNSKVKVEFLRLERLFHLAPRHQKYRVADPLLKDGLTSAFSIRRIPQAKFIKRYAEPMGGRQIAQEVYDNAHQRSSRALMLLATLGLDFNLPTTVTPRIDKNRIKKNAKAAEVADLVGSLDYCDSRHCESVLSPAAYLTDLLAFLAEVDTTDENTALEKFLKRRPDIANINLNCENTHQALPYIDLILEVLENEVAQISYDHEEIESGIATEEESIMLPKSEDVPQTTLETPQLKSYPEHLRVGAYETLKKIPSGGVIWGLPFNLWWEEVRTYLAHLGLNRVQLAEAFSKEESPTEEVITGERLGITSGEISILSDEGAKFAGYSENVEELLANNALLFEELEELLLSHFVNPEQKKIQYKETCSLTNATIDLQSEWNKFSRFRRLQSYLGWSVIELDRALRAIDSKLDEGSLRKLATLKQLQKDTGLPVAELLSWWYDLDTVDYAWKKKTVYSPYQQIFLDPTLGDQIVVNGEGKSITEEFDSQKLKGESTESTESKILLLGIIPYLSGALRMEEGDLRRLITEELGTTAELNLGHLSLLNRTASFLRSQELSLEEYWTLCALSEYRPLSTVTAQKNKSEATTSPEDTLKFLRLLQLLREGPFSIEEIDYLIRHRFRASQTFAPTGEKGNDFLLELRDGLYEINQAYDINRDDYAIAELENALRLYLSAEEDIARTLQIITHVSPLSADAQITFLEDRFGKVISDTYGIRMLRSLEEHELSDRINYLTKQLYRYLKPRLEQELIATKVGAAFEVPTPIAGKLCRRLNSPRAIPDYIAEEDRILDVFRHESYTGSKTEELSLLKVYPALFHSYQRLYKASWIIKKLGVVAEDVDFWLQRSHQNWLSIAHLPTQKQEIEDIYWEDFRGVLHVLRAYRFDQRVLQGDLTIYALLNQLILAEERASDIKAHLKRLQHSLEEAKIIAPFKKNETSLPELVEAVRDLENDFSITYDLQHINLPYLEESDQEEVLREYFNTEPSTPDPQLYFRFALARLLKNHTEWNEADLSSLLASEDFGFDFSADWKDGSRLYQYAKIFAVLQRAQAPVEQVRQWCVAAIDQGIAQSVKNAVKAKYTDEAWLKVAPELRNPIREKQRNALQVFVMDKLRRAGANPSPGEEEPPSIEIKDKHSLFEYFLLDTEMASCAMTSRIKQATLSVQLFVQRILMNLEAGIRMDQDLTQEWNWRQHYRVWEANRKVFLYPENWLEPELRTDKSPFFAELESELLQDEITADNVERAYRSYLHKLDQVAHLEPMGMYLDEDQDVLHVFARTKGHPHIYYYRRWMYHQYWTPWEKVEVDIEGDHLLPFVHNRRLFIAWPMFMEKAVEPSNEELKLDEDDEGNLKPPTKPSKYYEIRMAWSQYQEGKWSAKKLSKDKYPFDNSNIPMPQKQKSEYYFSLWSKKQLEEFISDLEKEIENSTDSFSLGLILNDLKVENSLLTEYSLITSAPENLSAFYGSRNNLNTAKHKIISLIKSTCDPTVNSFNWAFVKNKSISNQWIDYSSHQLVLPDQAIPKTYKILTDYGAQSSYSCFGYIYEEVSILEEVNGKALLPYQYYKFESQAPLFFQDKDHTFFIIPEKQQTPELDPVKAEKLLTPAISKPKTRNPSSIRIANPISTSSAYGVSNVASSNLQYFTDAASDSAIAIGTPRPGGSSCSQDTGTVVPPADGETSVEEGDSTTIPTVVSTYKFQPFYHPFVDTFIRQLSRYGIEGFLSPELFHEEEGGMLVRQGGQTDFDFQATYDPNDEVMPLDEAGNPIYPVEDIDFRPGGAYALYNWELFFHGPWMIAKRLTQEHKFAEARKWFHYIFDPTLAEGGTAKAEDGEDFQRCWKLKPFCEFDLEKTIQGILEQVGAGNEDYLAQIEAWEENPFDPHLIARLRIIAYMKVIVLNYLDNLIAHGDHLFAQDTMETINEATQLYVLAAQILGRTPVAIQGAKPTDKRFVDIAEVLDAFSNAAVALESKLGPARHRNRPFPKLARRKDPARALECLLSARITSKKGDKAPLYFSIPRNDKFLGYWTTVADRLFKIRHCMNIEGVTRQLDLFEPPIDPAMLVRARAAGLSIGEALSDLHAPLPRYRFSYMLQRALDFCNEVKSLGGALLSALEKKDAEALAQLRAGHELSMLKAQEVIKEKSISEVNYQLNGLGQTMLIAKHREQYYTDLIDEGWSTEEISAFSLSAVSLLMNSGITSGLILAGGLKMIPDFSLGVSGFGGTPHTTSQFGGTQLSGLSNMASQTLQSIATFLDKSASLTSTVGSYKRRAQEWSFQRNLSQKEQKHIELQIAAAEIRKAIAERDLDNHQKQIEQSQEAWDFMKDKYTNQALYSWMTTQLSRLYRESYKIAYDLAKQAEKAYRHELAVEDTGFIEFGYWDSLKKGLLAGEKLYHDLRRMEVAYLEKNRREFELTKHISLALLKPEALLHLRETGSCFFDISETLFDFDHPGHYLRRIKSISLTIPCVTGPYTSISAKLTLLSNRARKDITGTTDQNYPYDSESGSGFDNRFNRDLVGIQSIATSSAQGDSGLFELNFRDERYLPFEGAGAISSWRLELPTELRQFDYDTISDVIIHMNYTARDGGDTLRDTVNTYLREQTEAWVEDLAQSGTGLQRLFSIKDEFPTAWNNLTTKPDQTCDLILERKHFPYFTRGKEIVLNSIQLYFEPLDSNFTIPDGCTVLPDLGELKGISFEPNNCSLEQDTGSDKNTCTISLSTNSDFTEKHVKRGFMLVLYHVKAEGREREA